MRWTLPILLALMLALGGGAIAAPLDDARTAHATAVATLERIEAERAGLDRAHEALAAEIEGLKAAADAPLLPGVRDPRLDDRLKRARTLAESLAALDREASGAREAVERRRAALLSTLDGELTTRRAELARAPALERRALFEDLRGLIAERQALARPARPQAPPPTLPAGPADENASPDELRELADESRDHAEQVQGRLSMLEAQLSRLRERQRLVRAAAAFSRDDALFAQDERNRQVVRRQDGIAAATADPGERPTRTPTTEGDEGDAVIDADARDPDAPPNAPGDGEGPPEDGPEDDGAGFEADHDNAADPEAPEAGGQDMPDQVDGPALGVRDEPPPEGVPVGALDGGQGEPGALVVEEAFDPTLLEGLDELSPEALARRIAAIEARRVALEKTRGELKSRGDALDRKADALENE